LETVNEQQLAKDSWSAKILLKWSVRPQVRVFLLVFCLPLGRIT